MSFSTVTLDLDGTLLPGTTAFAEVLKQYGHGDAVAASDSRFFSGQTTLKECFMEQWGWFQKLSPADIHRALRDAPWIADLRGGIGRLREAGLDVRMLTDQPSTVTDYGSRWGLGPAISSPVTVHEGRQVDIDFQEDKLANLEQSGLAAADIAHVGNGANDVPVWQAGATGVAVFAPEPVASAADVALGSPDSFMAVVDAILDRKDAA